MSTFFVFGQASYIVTACILVDGKSKISSLRIPRLRASQPPLMPVYSGWADCMGELSAEGSLKRGAAAFWRPVRVAGGPQLIRYNPNASYRMH